MCKIGKFSSEMLAKLKMDYGGNLMKLSCFLTGSTAQARVKHAHGDK